MASIPAPALGASYNLYVCGNWSTNAGPFIPAAVRGTEAGAVECGATNHDLIIDRSGLQAVPSGQGAS